MQFSAYDLETHARTRREDLLREAQRNHLIDEARDREGIGRAKVHQRIARHLAAARNWVSACRGWEVFAPRVAPRRDATAATAADTTPAVRPALPKRPIRAAEPYAGMVIIARANAVPIADRPFGAGEG